MLYFVKNGEKIFIRDSSRCAKFFFGENLREIRKSY